MRGEQAISVWSSMMPCESLQPTMLGCAESFSKVEGSMKTLFVTPG